MNTSARRLTLGSLIVLSLARCRAAEPSTDVQPGNQRQATSQWTLSTDDTEVIVSVSNNKIFIEQSEESCAELELGAGSLRSSASRQEQHHDGQDRLFPRLDVSRRDGRQIGWPHRDLAVHQHDAESRIEIRLAGSPGTGAGGELGDHREQVGRERDL